MKKMLKRTLEIALAMCMCIAVALTGCTPNTPSQSTPTPGGEPSPTPQQQTQTTGKVSSLQLQQAKALIPFTPGEEDTTASRVADAIDRFSFALSAKLTGEENLIVSPFSVFLTLVALGNATEGDAQQQLLSALYLDDKTMEEVNEGVSRLLYCISNLDDANGYQPLSIANAVFVDDDVQLNKDFAQTVLDYLRASALQVDFAQPSAVDAINDWAKEHTNGLIDSIVTEFPPQMIAAVTNAIYFSDRWNAEFDPAQTTENVFHGIKGDSNAHFMLREGDSLPYYEDEQLQGFRLPFKTGGGMYVMLPKDQDANALLSSLTPERFEQIMQTSPKTGKLLLPRFTLDYNASLVEALSQMDLAGLFQQDQSWLTKLVEETPAFISQCLHKATIDVDEKGTTAAAVTVEMAAGAGMPEPTDPFEMICDRPFAFVIYGASNYGTAPILFTGVVNNIA